MREHGFDRRFPIVLYYGRILDGRTRFAAAMTACVKPKMIAFKGTKEQARQFVETANLHRRHLTPEQEQERRQARIETVVELRQEGMSERAIAEEVGVSPGQVHRDLEKATASGEAVTPPDGKVRGQDGRQQPATKPDRRCANCVRKHPDGGSMKGCEGCKVERKAHRSGRTEPGTHTSRRNSGKAKAGKPGFDWRPFYDAHAQLTRQIDTFGQLYGVKGTNEAEKLLDLAADLKKAFIAWAESVSKLKAPAY